MDKCVRYIRSHYKLKIMLRKMFDNELMNLNVMFLPNVGDGYKYGMSF